MKRDDVDNLAAEYVLGTLDSEKRLQVERAMGSDPALKTLVEDWQGRLAPLASDLAPVPPSDGLWDRIEARLDGLEQEPPGTVTVRADEGAWQRVTDEIEVKILAVDRESGMQTKLMRFAPGAELVSHPHSKLEECYVIEGDVQVGDLHLQAGDFHLAEAGSDHPVCVSQGGCLLLLRNEIRHAA